MITNNLGTLLYSFFYGKKVGQDKNGNKFYIHKYNLKRKWVLYNKIVDPTSLKVAWQLWLTNNKKEIPSDMNDNKIYIWQKEKVPNYSGSRNSYHPKISKNKFEKNKKNKSIKEIWSPE
jgi:NADH:ubiquinone oxidoreductase subunit